MWARPTPGPPRARRPASRAPAPPATIARSRGARLPPVLPECLCIFARPRMAISCWGRAPTSASGSPAPIGTEVTGGLTGRAIGDWEARTVDDASRYNIAAGTRWPGPTRCSPGPCGTWMPPGRGGMVDPEGALGDLAGKRVLCLASGAASSPSVRAARREGHGARPFGGATRPRPDAARHYGLACDGAGRHARPFRAGAGRVRPRLAGLLPQLRPRRRKCFGKSLAR